MLLKLLDVIYFSIKYFFKKYLGIIINKDRVKSTFQYSISFIDKLRIYLSPRVTKMHINLLGTDIEIVDSASFQVLFSEIFEKQVYKFITSSYVPNIIDCGANIGLSVIFFKKIYPNAKILAFEPDPTIYKILCSNIAKFNFEEVRLVEKAIWSKDTKVSFLTDGSDGGRIVNSSERPNREVETTSLRQYLQTKVDFLKIDIEGAEAEVMADCADLLVNVDNLFIEYHSFSSQEQNLHKILEILNNSYFRYHINYAGLKSLHPAVYVENINGIDNLLNIYAYRHN